MQPCRVYLTLLNMVPSRLNTNPRFRTGCLCIAVSASSTHTAHRDEPETKLGNHYSAFQAFVLLHAFTYRKNKQTKNPGEYIHLQWASHGLRLDTSMSKASSLLKPLPGKSWASFHRAMEFSAAMPGAQHFLTYEPRTNLSLFNSVFSAIPTCCWS